MLDTFGSGGWWMIAGGLFAALATGWRSMQAFVLQILSRAVVTARYEDTAAGLVARWFEEHGTLSRFGSRRYAIEDAFLRPAGRRQAIAVELHGAAGRVVWLGWRPVWVRFHRETANATASTDDALTVTFIRGTLDPERLAVEATRYRNHDAEGLKRWSYVRLGGNRGAGPREYHFSSGPNGSGYSTQEQSRKLAVARYLGHRREEIGEPRPAEPFAGLEFPPEALTYREHVRNWLVLREWFRSRGLPWRSGVLLYGPPGTGKSSMVRAIAQEFDLPLYSIDLATCRNPDFESNWRQAQSNAPAIVLLEDLDAVFEGRVNVTDGDHGDGLTFDCLLNTVGGVASTDGVLLVVTTNRVETIDPALGRPVAKSSSRSTRPGRIDFCLEFGPMTAACRQKLAEKLVGGDVADLVRAGDGESAAQFQARCVESALVGNHSSSLSLAR